DGPDLSVVSITRTPEYERYDNRGDAYVRMTEDGHESGVMMKPGGADIKKWPADGEKVTYTAIVKNVGSAPSSGCSYTWFIDFKEPHFGKIEGPLAPGESREVTLFQPFVADHRDHRNQPISFQIACSGQDACPSNNCLEIQACALNIGIW